MPEGAEASNLQRKAIIPSTGDWPANNHDAYEMLTIHSGDAELVAYRGRMVPVMLAHEGSRLCEIDWCRDEPHAEFLSLQRTPCWAPYW